MKPDGTINWPPEGTHGFVVDSSGVPITSDANITKGMLLDRYGESGGTFVSPIIDGDSYPYESRGLPYPESYQQKHTYEVVMDINEANYEEAFSKLTPAEQADLLGKMERYKFSAEDIYNPQIGEIAEVFGAGGGKQIKLGTSVSIYEKLGFLREVTN
ncbi:TPA: glycohydrolase toxin TNT-related protein [Streptococcus suis]